MDELSESLKKSLYDVVEKDLISAKELSFRIINCVKELSENESLHIIENFTNSDLSTVSHKEKFLYESFLDHIKTLKPPENFIELINNDSRDLSNRPKIEELLNRTRCKLVLSVGQRRYGGPPPYWSGPSPEYQDDKCTQVYIGKLPRDIFEDTLVPILEKSGRIYQLRIMIHVDTGENRGYAFVDFFTHEEACRFVNEANDGILKTFPGLVIKISTPCNRLSISGFTMMRTVEDVEAELKNSFPNSKSITAFQHSADPKRNSGHAFVEFVDHNDANTARKKLLSAKILIFNQVIREVNWADADFKISPRDGQVKRKLHVRFVNEAPPVDKLREIFERFGQISRLDKLEQFAFVEYESPESASEARESLDNKESDGFKLKVSWANSKVPKPSFRGGNQRLTRNRYDRPAYHDRHSEYNFPPKGRQASHVRYEQPYPPYNPRYNEQPVNNYYPNQSWNPAHARDFYNYGYSQPHNIQDTYSRPLYKGLPANPSGSYPQKIEDWSYKQDYSSGVMYSNFTAPSYPTNPNINLGQAPAPPIYPTNTTYTQESQFQQTAYKNDNSVSNDPSRNVSQTYRWS